MIKGPKSEVWLRGPAQLKPKMAAGVGASTALWPAIISSIVPVPAVLSVRAFLKPIETSCAVAILIPVCRVLSSAEYRWAKRCSIDLDQAKTDALGQGCIFQYLPLCAFHSTAKFI